LIVGVIAFSVNVTGITYNGVALGVLGTQVADTGVHVELWGLKNPASGSHNVVVSFDGSNDVGAGSMTFDGVHQTTPTGTFVGNDSDAGGSTTTPSVTLSSAAGEVVVDVLGQNFGASMTAGGGQTDRWNQGGSQLFDTGAGSTKAGASSVTMQWTLDSAQQWTIAAIPLKPA